MPKVSKYRKNKTTLEQARAFELYQKGLSLREVAEIVGRSHVWVRTAVKVQENLSTG